MKIGNKRGFFNNVIKSIQYRANKNPFLIRFYKRYLGTLVSVDTNKKIAALTFDDGPSRDWTPKILEVLESNNAKATFFVLGKNAERYPEIIRQAYESGHAIANHTYDHPSLPLTTRADRFNQLRKCDKSIKNYNCNLFRPPYGHQTILSRIELFLYRKDVVCWDIGVDDWQFREPEVMLEELSIGLHPGSIILLHDYSEGRSCEHTVKLLELFLVKHRDYKFVTVPELIKSGKRKEIFWLRKAEMHGKFRYQVI